MTIMGPECHRLGVKGPRNSLAACHKLTSGVDAGIISGLLAGPGHWQWS